MKADATALPIYVQTAEMLIREIASGRLIDGERLPPEREMASDIGIAVGTLRKALNDLADKGLLVRVQGSGNYVRHNPDATSVYSFFRLERLTGGGLPTAKVLDVEKVQKPDGLPAFGQSKKAHRIRRLRYLSTEPAALEEIWLDGKWASAISAQELSDSLYYYYRKTLGLVISRAEDRIGVAPLPDWPDVPIATDIGAKPGDIVGFVERWSKSTSGEIAEFSRTWFNPNRARYVARIK